MTDPASFAKMVPGFDFLQGLVKNAGAALPNVSQWIAPTLNPEELEKRIEELRTVQFWLEQNARMLGATIQALEVQRMTLSTLKTMNVSMGELRDALSIKLPEAGAPVAAAPTAPNTPTAPVWPPAASKKQAAPRTTGRAKAKGGTAATAAMPPVVDPMQWWGALTKQFTELAAGAMKDSATDAAKNLAGAMVKQSFDAAGETLKKAAAMPAAVAQTAVKTATTAATSAAKTAGSMAGTVASGAAAARRAASPAKKSAARKR